MIDTRSKQRNAVAILDFIINFKQSVYLHVDQITAKSLGGILSTLLLFVFMHALYCLVYFFVL